MLATDLAVNMSAPPYHGAFVHPLMGTQLVISQLATVEIGVLRDIHVD
jgi:hypothetical protein